MNMNPNRAFTPLDAFSEECGFYLTLKKLSFHRPRKDLTGFTLLESIVAIYILVVGLTSVISLTANSLSAVSRFKQELIASNLAQEGLELVKNKRDSNYLTRTLGPPPTPSCDIPFCDANDSDNNDLWGAGASCDDLSTGCQLNPWASPTNADAPLLDFEKCVGAGGCKIGFDSAAGFYGYNMADDSGFTRYILIDEPVPSLRSGTGPDLKDVRVRSVVSWQDRFVGTRNIVLETYLTPHLLN